MVTLNLCNIIRTQICNYIKQESFRLKRLINSKQDALMQMFPYLSVDHLSILAAKISINPLHPAIKLNDLHMQKLSLLKLNDKTLLITQTWYNLFIIIIIICNCCQNIREECMCANTYRHLLLKHNMFDLMRNSYQSM